MSVLVFIPCPSGRLNGQNAETLSYAVALAAQENLPILGFSCGKIEDSSALEGYGLSFLTTIDANIFEIKTLAHFLAEQAKKAQAKYLIFDQNLFSRQLANHLSFLLEAACIHGVIALPKNEKTFEKWSFSGKALTQIQSQSAITILTLSKGAFPKTKKNQEKIEIKTETILKKEEKINYTIAPSKNNSDSIELSQADIVVSGGRGLKGPENWGIIEDLAKILQAATACSRPVSDAHWRPHHEHVGQTGRSIAPNLYIAVGISGAIQHLAGVNASKIIVVINNDKEAPFFKNAHYGIIGDAFEIVPALIKKLENRKKE